MKKAENKKMVAGLCNVQKPEDFARELKRMYERVVEETEKEIAYEEIIKMLLDTQKEDGAWNRLDSYRIDGDARVEFGYVPTYHACATLIYVILKRPDLVDSAVRAALKNGLEFSTGRSLQGHGFDAMAGEQYALQVFEQAGIYECFCRYPQETSTFCEMWTNKLQSMEKAYHEGRTIYDWNVDYAELMKKRLELWKTARL